MFRKPSRIDEALRMQIGKPLANMVAHSATLPAYRFVDLYRAIERACRAAKSASAIDAQNMELLTDLLHGSGHPQINTRELIKADRLPWQVGPGKEQYLSRERIWVTKFDDPARCVVYRLRYQEYNRSSVLEVGTSPPEGGLDVLQDLIADSGKHSIFRAKIISLGYEAGTKDEYGDVEKMEQLHVTFSQISTVSEAEIVLSQDHLQLLERNMISLSERREILQKNGVPTKRGILLHGPPGTGKTYACRHICHRMTDTTRIFLTGSALGNVGAAFSLARLLQPSVIFVEDADLMFASRTENLYSSNLGELMDQMDGLRPAEEVSIVMTTNALERMEGALKDRPGRISQCIYMGAPGADLREILIRRQLGAYDISGVNVDRLVSLSRDATQAFLNEWIHRAVQVGCEELLRVEDDLDLRTEHFEVAIEEMRSNKDENAGRIVGFLPGSGVS